MGKNPAYLMYPSDWQRDLDDHPLEIEGAWIRICNRLFWTGGTATKTLDEWSRILRKKSRETEKIFEYFSSKNICDLVNQNGTITITSRRMVRDEYIRTMRVKVGKLGGNPGLLQIRKNKVLVNQIDNQKDQSSVSVSVSVSKRTKDIPLFFEKWWTTYPMRNGKRLGKKECCEWFTGNIHNGDEALLLKATENYVLWCRKTDRPPRDPIRFLKKDFWRDLIEDNQEKKAGYYENI
jgi:hypothetical protein